MVHVTTASISLRSLARVVPLAQDSEVSEMGTVIPHPRKGSCLPFPFLPLVGRIRRILIISHLGRERIWCFIIILLSHSTISAPSRSGLSLHSSPFRDCKERWGIGWREERPGPHFTTLSSVPYLSSCERSECNELSGAGHNEQRSTEERAEWMRPAPSPLHSSHFRSPSVARMIRKWGPLSIPLRAAPSPLRYDEWTEWTVMGPKGPSHITPPVTKVKKLPALVTRGLSAASTRRALERVWVSFSLSEVELEPEVTVEPNEMETEATSDSHSFSSQPRDEASSGEWMGGTVAGSLFHHY